MTPPNGKLNRFSFQSDTSIDVAARRLFEIEVRRALALSPSGDIPVRQLFQIKMRVPFEKLPSANMKELLRRAWAATELRPAAILLMTPSAVLAAAPE